VPNKHIVILGGGFGGMTTAESLEHLFGADQSVEFTLVSETNALLFTPMLAEVAGSSLEPTHISSPLRTALHRTRVIRGRATQVDLKARRVMITLSDGSTTQTLTYDHLVLALGAIALEGRELVAVELGHTDTDYTTCLNVPSIGLVVAGDAAYNDVHLYLAESNAQTRREWISALDKIESLNPRAVVATHKRSENDDSPGTSGVVFERAFGGRAADQSSVNVIGRIGGRLMGKLDGKVALVTGGNSGIGFATAKEFVGEGAYVFVTGRREKELAAAVEEIGSNVTGIRVDVSNSEDLDRLFSDQKRKRKTRCRLRKRRHCEIRTARPDKRRTLPVNVRRQREGRAVHSPKGSPFGPAGRINHPERVDRREQRPPRKQCLQRYEGGGSLLCTNLDDGFERPAHSCKCREPWFHRYGWLKGIC
jgi:short chain dehydrogenase/Pyridine nucleotide-disulphide oxidoreductase